MTSPSEPRSEVRVGQVIFKSSRHVTVLIGDRRWSCELRGALRRHGIQIVVGDFVEAHLEDTGTGVVEKVLPRRRWLSRKRRVGGGRELILASNIDQVVAVFATRKPRFKPGALDRLLVAAERQGLPVTIVVNKLDLGLQSAIAEQLEGYQSIGYPVLRLSVVTEVGLESFYGLLDDRVTVVVGPSGVGKSSLLRPLFPDEDIRVGEVSHYNEKGRHTTTATTWYPLPGGGAVVDTPGFKEYALWGVEPWEIAEWMPDLQPLRRACRFANCLHRDEPGCAVRGAVESGEVSPERYRSYIGILGSLED